jgi:general secretion pathway protein F
MPIYEYQGINQDGKKVKGTIDADSLRSARIKLKSLSIYTTAIKESTSARNKIQANTRKFNFSFSPKISTARLAQETRQLSTLIGAGIPIVEALQVLSEQTDSARFRRIVIDAKEMVEDGSSLARALGRFPESFPRLYINLVASGEASGQLDSVLENLSEHFESQLELKRKVQNSLFYPILMFVICTLVVVGLVTYVVPTIVAIFQKEGAILPLPTRIMITISNVITGGWYIIVSAFLVINIILIRAYKTDKWRKLIDDRLLRIPVISTIYKKIYTARIASTLSTLLASGVELLTALDIIKSLLGNVHVVKAVEEARDGVREGRSLAKEFGKSGLFPHLFCQMVAIGEKSGRLEIMLQKAGVSYKNEVSSAITGLTTLIGPIMIVVLGTVVLCIVISVLMPMFDLMNKMAL